MVTLMFWAALKVRCNVACIFIGASSMALMSGIVLAAVGQNEASFPTVLFDFFSGVIWSVILCAGLFPVFHDMLKSDDTKTQLPLYAENKVLPSNLALPNPPQQVHQLPPPLYASLGGYV